MKRLEIGTSGWHYKDWIGRFYPKTLPSSEHLPYYTKHFSTVELNGVFYRLPTPGMVRTWYQRAPQEFLFAYKASRFLTHMKKLKDPKQPLRLMFRRADLLKEKLGPILYQLPPFYPVHMERLKTFFKALPQGYAHVMEFRHPSWFTEAVYDVMRHYQVSLCLYDMKLEESPQVVTGPLVYIRMHGTVGKYAGGYTRPMLKRWAQRIQKWRKEHPVYVYFNNDIKGHAIKNAQALKALL